MVLTSAGLFSIHTSDGSCLCHEWTSTNLFNSLLFFFFSFFLDEFMSRFHSFQIFTIYGQGFFSNFAKMQCDDVVVHPPAPLPELLMSLGGLSWAVKGTELLPEPTRSSYVVEVGTTGTILAKVGNEGWALCSLGNSFTWIGNCSPSGTALLLLYLGKSPGVTDLGLSLLLSLFKMLRRYRWWVF